VNKGLKGLNEALMGLIQSLAKALKVRLTFLLAIETIKIN
jgi:hypothetical protein